MMKKVLILEDDRWFAESLAAILERDFLIQICSDPEKVFEILEKSRPDLLLADVILGAKNLFVLLNEMQSYVDTRNLKIVILSSAAAQIDPRDLAEFNVRKVLNKSEITPETLREILKEICEKGKTERAK